MKLKKYNYIYNGMNSVPYYSIYNILYYVVPNKLLNYNLEKTKNNNILKLCLYI